MYPWSIDRYTSSYASDMFIMLRISLNVISICLLCFNNTHHFDKWNKYSWKCIVYMLLVYLLARILIITFCTTKPSQKSQGFHSRTGSSWPAAGLSIRKSTSRITKLPIVPTKNCNCILNAKQTPPYLEPKARFWVEEFWGQVLGREHRGSTHEH